VRSAKITITLLLLWTLGIPQCVGHSYGSTIRRPEDDSVESKHVALLSHYTLHIFSIYCCCVWLTFTPLYWTELSLHCCRHFLHSAGFHKTYEVLALTMCYILKVSQAWQFRFLRGTCYRSKSICCKDIAYYSYHSYRTFSCIQYINQQNALSKIQ